MLRFTLLLTVGLVFVPSYAFADGTDCPLHKRLNAQKAVQTTALIPVTVSTLAVEIPQISAPRQVAALPPIPPSEVAPMRGVDRPVTSEAAPIQLTQAQPAQESPIMAPSIHTDWTAILQKYVSVPDDLSLRHFDYAGLKANAADTAKLDAYINDLEGMNPEKLSENEAIAFWANLYNAVTIQVVTESYPIKSIRKLGSFNSGPWKKDLITVNGRDMSLDDVEHKTLRVKYPSPYIHYMVNCASVGCPNLLNEAWEADTLMAKRKKAAANYINSPRGAVVKGDKLTVSSIYDWFEEDFGDSKAGVIEHLSQYATGDLAIAISSGAEIKKYDYDWSLNN